jgi:hypothetical protein
MWALPAPGGNGPGPSCPVRVGALPGGPTCPVSMCNYQSTPGVQGPGGRLPLQSRTFRRGRGEPWVEESPETPRAFGTPSDLSCGFCRCRVRRSLVGLPVTLRFVRTHAASRARLGALDLVLHSGVWVGAPSQHCRRRNRETKTLVGGSSYTVARGTARGRRRNSHGETVGDLE